MQAERSVGGAAFSAQKALAEGFADRAVSWAAAHGAAGEVCAALRAAAHDVSLATALGHVCCDLGVTAAALERPLALVRAQLLSTGLVGTPQDTACKVLIVDADQRLYLHRYFDYERRLAQRLGVASKTPPLSVGEGTQALLHTLFPCRAEAAPEAAKEGPDWQKLATALALEQPIVVISGGPGTGKTTTVAKILACVLADQPRCRIGLCAPTGKAAARMLEALRSAAASLPEDLRQLLPGESFTVHRLLGYLPATGGFRHHAGNPLAIDLLVVDEASMLDLALAVKLLEAVPASARLILLGDKDQLAAVEAGAVFSELSADPTLGAGCIQRLAALAAVPAELIQPPTPRTAGLGSDRVVWLAKSYRFSAHSGLGRFAHHVRLGEAQEAMGLLRAGEDPALQWLDDAGSELAPLTFAAVRDGLQPFLRQMRAESSNKAALFEALGTFRVLCALREGLRGVVQLNGALSRWFRAMLAHPLDRGDASPWYPGRVVMVLRNDHVLKLFNGDVGIVLPDDQGSLKVFFPDRGGACRSFAPQRLPEHDTAYAITVHKAQVSEFSRVALVLPATPHRVVARELLYTAATRARDGITIVGSGEVILKAVNSPTERHTGLASRLRDDRVPIDQGSAGVRRDDDA